jgi:hypothetical protein
MNEAESSSDEEHTKQITESVDTDPRGAVVRD